MVKLISKFLAALVAFTVVLGTMAPAEAGTVMKDPPPEMQGLERFVAASASAAVAYSPGTGSIPVISGSLFVNNYYGIYCWRGSASKADYNDGKLKWKATFHAEWCASGGKIINKTIVGCVSRAGYFRVAQTCSVQKYGTGYSNQKITADWGFAFGYGFLTANIDVDLTLYLGANGKYWGTWYWNG